MGPRMVRPADGINHRGERALFRFSTEGILPTWMPLPAFSFEVVRRPTRQEQPAAPANNINQGGLIGQQMNGNNPRNPTNGNNQQSLRDRILGIFGAVPMTREEEARALEQLVDMFPQYDRADLLRELRDRGSAQAVVDSVFLGFFSGRVRGSAGGPIIVANDRVGDNQGGEATTAGGTVALPQLDVVNNPVVEPSAREVTAQI